MVFSTKPPPVSDSTEAAFDLKGGGVEIRSLYPEPL